MITDAANRNPHYRSAARQRETATPEFVAASYVLAVVIPIVGFAMGFALLFKRREGHGTLVMIVAVAASLILALQILSMVDGPSCLEAAADACRGFD